jgi:high-affinity nickel-transport protein
VRSFNKVKEMARAAARHIASPLGGLQIRVRSAAMLPQIFDDAPERTRGKIMCMYILLVTANAAAWAWALMEFRADPLLIGTAFLAYSFGVRHAFDADHIAAIDNVTRKLMQEGRRPIAVGFFFSLGHSTIVFGLVVAVALTTAAVRGHFETLRAVGGLIGTSVSALFLFAIAFANILVLIQVYRALQAAEKGRRLAPHEVDAILAARGLLGRLLRPTFRLIRRSWHVYPLGLLFGLGFDTATEVGLLGVSAAQAAHGLSILSILLFPALFTVGMSLMDTTDNVLMVGTYGWALIKPVRKLHYNLSITFASVVAAIAIGGIELLSLIGGNLGLNGPLWRFVALAGENSSLVGSLIVAFFILSWLASYLFYRVRIYDRPDAS